jgi:hypothetical protein
MRRRFSLHKKTLFLLIAIAFITILVGMVFAAAASLGSGYAVTSNWQGVDVPVASDVTVTAMTTDPTITQVAFLWENPGGQIVWNEIIDVHPNGTTYNGKLVYYADSTHDPADLGDWGVHALFLDSDGKTIQGIENVIAIRSTSFNVIPEIPILGTAGASIAMVAGFTYKMKRKPKK